MSNKILKWVLFGVAVFVACLGRFDIAAYAMSSAVFIGLFIE